MFFRIALLALLALTISCKKQRRTIVRGFTNETENLDKETPNLQDDVIIKDNTTINDKVTEPKRREKVQHVSTLEARGIAPLKDTIIAGELITDTAIPQVNTGDNTTINNKNAEPKKREKVQPILTLEARGITPLKDTIIAGELITDTAIPQVNTDDNAEMGKSDDFKNALTELLDEKNIQSIKDEIIAQVRQQALDEINEIDIDQDSSPYETFEQALSAGLHEKTLERYNKTVNPELVETIKAAINEIVADNACKNCQVNFENIDLSINSDNKVIINNFTLNDEYQEEEKFAQDGALPRLQSLEISNAEKALEISQIHFAEIAYAEIDENGTRIPTIEPIFKFSN